MPHAGMHSFLMNGYCGHLATVGADGTPYVCPLLYVWLDGKIWLHNTRAQGHLRSNIEHDSRVCFEVSTPGEVFAYGRFECDTAIEYRSVICFGTVAIVAERDLKARFFDALLSKYFRSDDSRPGGFYPRLDETTVYVLSIDRMSGKETVLPAASEQWPAVDRTKSPNAKAPVGSR